MMHQETRNDMSMSGIGKIAAGIYNHIRVDGVCKVGGDIDCILLDTNGKLNIEGSVQAESVRANGTLSLDGALTCGSFVLDGMAGIKGQAVCSESIIINGRVAIDKGLSSEKVEVSGSLKSKGDVECEVFSVNGGFAVDGLLNAGLVDIKLNMPCKAREIGGEQITVRRFKKVSVLLQITPAFNASLKTDVIEGDVVDLEYTEADVVRGNEVRIGPGCKIGRVEYKQDFRRDGDGKVGSFKRI